MEQERERKRDDKRPRQVDQQGTIDSWDLYWCQSEGQTGSQLWFVPVTLLTLFNLGFGQLTAQTTSVHSHRKLGNARLHESLESDHRDALYGHTSADTAVLCISFCSHNISPHNLTCCSHWLDSPSQSSKVQNSITTQTIPLNN